MVRILGPPRQVDRRQRSGGGHVRPCPLDGPNGKLVLAHVIPTGCLGIAKSLSDDILKVRVHVGNVTMKSELLGIYRHN